MHGYYDLLRRTGGGYTDVRSLLIQSKEYVRRCEGGACERAYEAVRALFVRLLRREPDLEALDSYGNEVCVCVRVRVRVPVCVCLSACLPACLSVCLSVCLSAGLYRPLFLFDCLWV